MAEQKNKAWQIELTLPKGRIKTHVYSDTGEDIENRFPGMDCKVIGAIEDPLSQTKAQPRPQETYL